MSDTPVAIAFLRKYKMESAKLSGCKGAHDCGMAIEQVDPLS
jgi:hypothetical protein